jgi:hypothetical protein
MVATDVDPGGRIVARLTRRQALAALGGGLLAAACADDDRPRRGGRITAAEIAGGGLPLSFNVHPLGGRFLDLQFDALRRLRPPSVRLTLGLVTDTDAARPYIRAVADPIGLVSDFRLFRIGAAEWPNLVEATLRRYPTVRRAELLNEPDHFNGLAPDRYVREYLRPGYERIRERLPGVQVVAAAPVGDRKRGPDAFRRMTDAGADEVCDYRAVHVYFDDAGALSTIAGATRRPILVTETGTSSASQHVRWYTEVIPQIRATFGTDQVFWYVLLESASLAGGTVPYSHLGFSVISSTPGPSGQARGAPGSGLYSAITGLPLEPTV